MGWKPTLQCVSQTNSGTVKRAWEEKVWPAAIAALSSDHRYPKDLEVLKVVINLSYRSMHKKLQKGYEKKNGNCSFVHLKRTFKKTCNQEIPLEKQLCTFICVFVRC